MKRAEMLDQPVRMLDMYDRLCCLGSVKLSQLTRAGEAPYTKFVDDHWEVGRYYHPVKSFDVFVAEWLCGFDYNVAIEADLVRRQVVSSRYSRVTYSQLEIDRLMLPINENIVAALGELAKEQDFRLPDMASSGSELRRWVMFAQDIADKASNTPMRQLKFVRLEDAPVLSNNLIVDLPADSCPYLRQCGAPGCFTVPSDQVAVAS